ncbi:MAG: type II toxin-antitoxin system RelE/ParE family toxin [Vulcanimicrobiaceae bacterium]
MTARTCVNGLAGVGRPRHEFGDGVRSIRVRPVVPFYRFQHDEIIVLRIVDGRRDLGTIFADDT